MFVHPVCTLCSWNVIATFRNLSHKATGCAVAASGQLHEQGEQGGKRRGRRRRRLEQQQQRQRRRAQRAPPRAEGARTLARTALQRTHFRCICFVALFVTSAYSPSPDKRLRNRTGNRVAVLLCVAVWAMSYVVLLQGSWRVAHSAVQHIGSVGGCSECAQMCCWGGCSECAQICRGGGCRGWRRRGRRRRSCRSRSRTSATSSARTKARPDHSALRGHNLLRAAVECLRSCHKCDSVA